MGVGDGGFGLLFGLPAATGIFSILLGGILVDRRGAFSILRLCALGIGLSLLFMSFSAESPFLFAFGLAVTGLCSPALVIALNAHLVRLFPGKHRRVLSVQMAASSTGGLLLPVLAETLLKWSRVSESISFGIALKGVLLLSGVFVLPSVVLLRKPCGAGQEEATRRPEGEWNWRHLLPPRSLAVLVVLMGLHGAADTTLYTWMPRILGALNLSHSAFGPGFVLSGYSAAYLVSRTLLAVTKEKRGKNASLVFPGLSGGILLIMGLLGGSYWTIALGYIVGAFLWSVEYPSMMGRIAQECPARFGALQAAPGILTYLFTAVGINGVGVLLSLTGERAMTYILLLPSSLFPIIGISAFFWMRGGRRNPHRTTSSF